MTDLTHLETTRRDYDSMAERYAEFVADALNDEPFGRALIGVFADLVGLVDGHDLVLDAGCGPGHLTDLLARLGRSVRGVDLSPAMVELARSNRPDLSFEVGSILDLQLADSTFGGVLAHFSIIHTPPAQVPTAFAECARVLVPGGYLLLGFQSGNDGPQTWEAFDHKVSPAYRWSIDALAALLRTAGFLELARLRAQRDRFPAGYLLMQKADT